MALNTFELRKWIENWENLLKNPNNLFVSMTIPNIAQYLLDELNIKSKSKSHKFHPPTYEKELLDFLIFKINDKKNLENKIYSKNLLTQIRRNLKHNIVKKRHIELLSANQFNNALIRRYNTLFNFLISKNQEYIIPYVLPYLLRTLLNEYSPEYLKKLPQQIFAESYFQNYEKVIEKIMTDLQKSTDTDQILDNLFNEIEECRNFKLNYNEVFSKRIRWSKNNDYLTVILRKKLLNESSMINPLLNNNNFNTIKNLLKEIITSFIEITIDKLSNFILLEYLNKVEDTIGIGDYNEKYNFDRLKSRFIEKIPINADSFPYSYIARSYFWAFINLINKYLKKNVNVILNKEIDLFFAEFINFLKINKDKINNSYFSTNFESLIYSFDFKLFITHYNEMFIERNVELIKDQLLNFTNEKKSILKEEYLKQISKNLIKYLKSEGFKLIPFSIDRNLIKKSFDSLFEKFYQKDQAWQIFYTISNLDCNNTLFSIGEAIFYDSRTWDFGESYRFDLPTPLMNYGELNSEFITYRKYSEQRGSIDFRRNSARALININAKDPYIAIKKGQVKISKVIDSLVFASSAKNTYGSRPTIYGNSQALNKDQNGILNGNSIPYNEILKINEKYRDIIKNYDQLLTTNTNKFKLKLEKSFSWYNIGRWNNFSHDRYTGFWIALEQLILIEGLTKKILFYLLFPN